MKLSKLQIKKVLNSGFIIEYKTENNIQIIKSISKGPLYIWEIVGDYRDNFKIEYQTSFLIQGYYRLHKKYATLSGAMSRNKLNKTYQSYSDPGHGWLKVSIADLYMLGIESKISHYSYINNYNVFLEEDCDLTIFINAMESKNIDFKINEHSCNNSSKIRNYAGYVYSK